MTTSNVLRGRELIERNRAIRPRLGATVLYVHRVHEVDFGTISVAIISRLVCAPNDRCKLHVLLNTSEEAMYRTECDHDEDTRAPGTWHWDRGEL